MYHHADHLGMMVFVVYSRCQAFLRLTRSFDRGGWIRTNDLQGAEIDMGGSKIPAQQLARRAIYPKKNSSENNASELLKVLVAGAGFEPTTSGL